VARGDRRRAAATVLGGDVVTLFLVVVMVFGLGFAIGHMRGFDAGVLETEAIRMLRGAFVERPLRRRLP
jgi:hypothetical protein